MSLQEWLQDASSLLNGEAVFDEKLAPVNQDERYESLFKDHAEEFDAITKQVLEISVPIA